MKRKDCLKLVRAIDDQERIKHLLRECIKVAPERVEKRGTWQYYAARLLASIENDFKGNLAFSVFVKNGNKKLPFYAFSSLALADCPGKGKCASFCYSLTGWRYPAAFFRQLQNSLLMRHSLQTIVERFRAIPEGKTLRLFVDGDFKDVETLRFWMDQCKLRPDLQVYGYSKSWKEFLQLDATGYEWPKNYLTNASSGSKYENTGIANAFLALPIVRGDFKAVQVDKKWIQSRAYQDKTNEGSKTYRAEVLGKLKKMTKKAFACPGSCGNCLPNGKHACGSTAFAGVAIGIGIH
jgi:hypothetical protein